jgi:hypothetical protein
MACWAGGGGDGAGQLGRRRAQQPMSTSRPRGGRHAGPRGGGARRGPRCWAAQRVSRMGLAEGWKGVFLFISNLFLYPFSFPIKFIHKNDPRIKWMHTQGNMSDQNNSVTA